MKNSTQGTETDPILSDSTFANSTSGDILKKLQHMVCEPETQR